MNELEEARLEIASVDKEIAALFERRMLAVDRVLDYKVVNGLPVLDVRQEEKVIANNAGNVKDPSKRESYVLFLKEMMRISRAYQESRMMSMKNAAGFPLTLSFRSGEIAYDITVGSGILSEAGSLFNLRRKVLVVTDKGVPPRYVQAILDQCAEGWMAVLEGGEDHKDTGSVDLILSALLEHGFTRGDAVVAVGGGVVGDTAGFAAACYMRGIDWYNVPTTLLSQVDSSVGGKTGINFGGVKNMVGAFHHPAAVLVDTDVLATLSPRLLSEGLAEVIKMAATSDAALFKALESATDISPLLPEIVASALRIKISVVEQDPEEQGLRAVLNFGHTIGHAIEAAGKGLFHGEAVAIGMMYMSSGTANERIERLLKKFGLPMEDAFGVEELMAFALHDKKKRGGKVKLVKVDEIGSFRFEETDPAQLESIIKARKI